VKAVLDACVLYPTVMRNLLLACADAGLYRPHWSDRILEEWARAAARAGTMAEAVARGEIAILRRDWSKACVSESPAREAELYLPDANDVHVLASGIEAGCEKIVTMNLKDFPRRELAAHGVQAVHPDEFLLGLFNQSPDQVCDLTIKVHSQAERLSGQEWPIRALMKKARLPRFGKAIERFS
jgi:hypothetical protein